MKTKTLQALQVELEYQREAFKLDACDYVREYSQNDDVKSITNETEDMTSEEVELCLNDFRDWDDNAEDGTRAFYTLGKIKGLEEAIRLVNLVNKPLSGYLAEFKGRLQTIFDNSTLGDIPEIQKEINIIIKKIEA